MGTTVTTHEEVLVLITLLEKQCGYYRVVLEMATATQDMFKSKRPFENIISMLKKQKIMLSCIKEEEDELFKRKERWMARDEKTRFDSEVEELSSAISSLVDEVVAVDESNQCSLMEHMEALKKEAMKADPRTQKSN